MATGAHLLREATRTQGAKKADKTEKKEKVKITAALIAKVAALSTLCIVPRLAYEGLKCGIIAELINFFE